MKTTLYAKNANGSIQIWSIEEESGGLKIEYGRLDGSLQTKYEDIDIGKVNRTIEEQIRSRYYSRINKKLDQGYVESKGLLSDTRTNMLGFARPMLAKPLKNVSNIDYSNAFYQNKYDGNRCLVTKKNGQIIAYTRAGKIINSIQHILEGIKLSEGETIDGELYCHGVPLQTINSWIKRKQSATANLSLRVYDAMMNKPYEYRLDFIRSITLGNNASVVPTYRISKESSLNALLSGSIASGYEGGIIRWGGNGYEDSKRSSSLVKLKVEDDGEFEIIDVIESKDGWARLVLDIGNSKQVTVTAPGDMDRKYEIAHNPDIYIGKLLTIKYFGLTNAGKPFQPIAVDFRDDI